MWQALCWPIPLFCSIVSFYLIIWETYNPEHYSTVLFSLYVTVLNLGRLPWCELLCGLGFAWSWRWSFPLCNFQNVLWFHDAHLRGKRVACDAWNPAVWGQHLCMLDLPQLLFRFVHLNFVPKPAPRSAEGSWCTVPRVLPSSNLYWQARIAIFFKAFVWILRLLCFRPGRCESSSLLSYNKECFHLASYHVYFSWMAVILAIKPGKESYQFIHLDTHSHNHLSSHLSAHWT